MLKEYIHVDWVISVDEKKSTSGGAFFLGDTTTMNILKNRLCI